MAYQEVDTSVKIVVLGGTNKENGQPNPTKVEGYFVGTSEFKTKYGMKKLYELKTSNGAVGLLGGGDLNNKMKKAKIGAMTEITDTGRTEDIGKGNPMKVYRVRQDETNTLDTTTEYETQEAYSDVGEEETYDEPEYTPPVSPRTPLPQPSSDRAAKVQALLNKRK